MNLNNQFSLAVAELTQNVSEPASRIKEKREISLFSKRENGIHIHIYINIYIY